jgi:hypothetical protein
LAPHSHPFLPLPGPPPLAPSSPESATDCSAPTKIFHPDLLYSNASNTRDNHLHQPALLSSTEPDNSTAQADPDKSEYADAPNPNPVGECDIV